MLEWDKVGEHIYETGTDRGVLFVMKNDGTYEDGVAWSGITGVTESPSGAESNKQYADNIAYLDLISAEEYGATIEAFTYPDEFKPCMGEAEVAAGVTVGQQNRKKFGFSWRTKVGNDTVGSNYGYKLHIFWNASAAPSEKGYSTENDSPEAMTMSWEISTTPVGVTVSIIEGEDPKPTACITIDSTQVDKTKLKALEDKLYGGDGSDGKATLPTPDEVITMFKAMG